jgi:hypothetical protein
MAVITLLSRVYAAFSGITAPSSSIKKDAIYQPIVKSSGIGAASRRVLDTYSGRYRTLLEETQ